MGIKSASRGVGRLSGVCYAFLFTVEDISWVDSSMIILVQISGHKTKSSRFIRHQFLDRTRPLAIQAVFKEGG